MRRSPSRAWPAHFASPNPRRNRPAPTGRAGWAARARGSARAWPLERLVCGRGRRSALWRTGGPGAASRAARYCPALWSSCWSGARLPGASAAAGAAGGCEGTLDGADPPPRVLRPGNRRRRARGPSVSRRGLSFGGDIAGDFEKDRPQPTSPRPPLSRDPGAPRGAGVGGAVQPAAAHSGTETRREGDAHSGQNALSSKGVGRSVSRGFFDLTRERVRRAEFHYEKQRSS